jgi:hypothetical protein
MARRPSIALLFVLATALLAGCGSSSSSSGSSSGVGSATSSTATAPTSSTGTSTSPISPGGAAAVAACKQGVEKLPHLKQSTIERLEAICRKADSGDVNATRKAAVEACRELVNASPLPPGAARDRALAACDNAGGAGGAK